VEPLIQFFLDKDYSDCLHRVATRIG